MTLTRFAKTRISGALVVKLLKEKQSVSRRGAARPQAHHALPNQEKSYLSFIETGLMISPKNTGGV